MADYDLVAGDFDVGDDPFTSDEEVGASIASALNNPLLKGNPALQRMVQAAAVKAAAKRPALQSSPPLIPYQQPSIPQVLRMYEPGGSARGRVLMANIDSVATIAAAATQSVTCKPQKKFRADRFTIAPSAASWLVNDIKIGTESLFVTSSGSIGGGFFDPAATSGPNLRGTTADPGVEISVSVTNGSGGALRFTGAFTGPSLD